MMWKTLIFLTVTSVVIAGKINNERHANYAFHIKHDYDYLKHRDKIEHHKHETEEKPQIEQEEEHHEDGKEEEQKEEINNEPEQANESDDSNTESEESKNEEENESPNYEFFYKVVDSYKHDNKGQHEKKHGGEIKGVYWLVQPDGYKRTVDYHVDKHSGFQAKVDYSKSEEHTNEEDHSKPISEYYVKTYRGSNKYIPVKEEQEGEQEQDKQEESAEHIPIFVI